MRDIVVHPGFAGLSSFFLNLDPGFRDDAFPIQKALYENYLRFCRFSTTHTKAVWFNTLSNYQTLLTGSSKKTGRGATHALLRITGTRTPDGATMLHLGIHLGLRWISVTGTLAGEPEEDDTLAVETPDRTWQFDMPHHDLIPVRFYSGANNITCPPSLAPLFSTANKGHPVGPVTRADLLYSFEPRYCALQVKFPEGGGTMSPFEEFIRSGDFTSDGERWPLRLDGKGIVFNQSNIALTSFDLVENP